jgi:hypothetical protein
MIILSPQNMLVELQNSWKPEKKLVAIFDSHAPVHFGARGYGDYLKYRTKDPALAEIKRRSYIARHGATENWKNPYAPGTLARYILWEFTTSPVKKYNDMFF